VQAQDLVAVLKPFRAGRILSSPFVRCIETVEPLARKLRLKVEEVDELEEGRGQAAVSLLAEVLGLEDSVVACTHGDVVLDTLRSVARDVPARPPSAKGSVWVLERAPDGGPATARYLPAPS
jgi:8-oxo-dGTP diphosphatase